MNFAFYVSGKAGRLKKLIEMNSDCLKDTVLVFADDVKTSYLDSLLQGHGIQYHYFDYAGSTLKDKNLALSNKMLEVFKDNNIDYCYCFGAHILKGQLINVYENKIVNFHPSILPMFPGVNAIDKAIGENAKLLGNTAHFIDSGVDTGPIIMQSIVHRYAFEYGNYDTILDIQLEMIEKIHELLKNNKIKIKNNNVYIDGVDYKKHFIFPVV